MTGATMDEVKNRLEHITEDLSSIKKALITIEVGDAEKNEGAWRDIVAASREISKRWKGPSAVEEIRAQREKRQ